MAAANETVLIKAPHRRQKFTEQQLEEFLKCADPDTGPAYFMDNFFYKEIHRWDTVEDPRHDYCLLEVYV